MLLDLAAEADDGQTRAEALEKLEAAARELGDAEFRQMLGGENDASNAIVSINSGAGGTDACDPAARSSSAAVRSPAWSTSNSALSC